MRNLDFSVVISKESDKALLTKSIETITAETCLPVEIMHGHVIDLIEKDVDYIFLPFIVNGKQKEGNPTSNCNCPWIQTYPFMVKAALRGKLDESKLLIPTLHFRYFERALVKELTQYFSEKFGLKKSEIKKAIYKADEIQIAFEDRSTLNTEKIFCRKFRKTAGRLFCLEDHITVLILS